MSGDQIVALVAIFMALVLAVNHGALRRLPFSKGLRLALIWAGIFAIVILFVSLVGGQP